MKASKIAKCKKEIEAQAKDATSQESPGWEEDDRPRSSKRHRVTKKEARSSRRAAAEDQKNAAGRQVEAVPTPAGQTVHPFVHKSDDDDLTADRSISIDGDSERKGNLFVKSGVTSPRSRRGEPYPGQPALSTPRSFSSQKVPSTTDASIP